jgi:PPM family protein phosphatase
MLRVAEQFAATDTGRQRRANEDSLLARSPLFVVADGMGGAQAGEVASQIAVECFGQGLSDSADPQASLAAQVLAANARIHELSHSNAEQAGMGTTLTAIYVGEQEVSIAHVGDSRAYCLRDGELLKLTDDHSLVDELIREGKLTPEEAEDHPQRSIITRALGPEPEVEVDLRSYRARAGDVYLLCSDGLTSMVGEELVRGILVSHERVRDAGAALIEAANEAGGRDNITVVLLRLEDVGPAPRQSVDLPTMTGMPAVGRPGEAAAAESSVALAEPDGRSNGFAEESVRRRLPRAPKPAGARTKGRRGQLARRTAASLVVLAILAILASGAYLALQSVYFIGTNARGLVTLYRGVPYELPGGLKLYSSDFVSGVGAATLSAPRRRSLLDHSLRSEADASGLIKQLELGELSE